MVLFFLKAAVVVISSGNKGRKNVTSPVIAYLLVNFFSVNNLRFSDTFNNALAHERTVNKVRALKACVKFFKETSSMKDSFRNIIFYFNCLIDESVSVKTRSRDGGKKRVNKIPRSDLMNVATRRFSVYIFQL